jgi:outer membrane protein assembly factor BamA
MRLQRRPSHRPLDPSERGPRRRNLARAASRWLVVFALALAVATLAGCYSVPPARQAVDHVRIQGATQVSSAEIEDRIATAPSPRFLGIWEGVVFDYRYYDKFVVQRDIARIQRYLQAQGFYDARVTAGRVIETTAGHVRVEIVVEEGEPATIEIVRFSGLESVPFELQAQALNSVRLATGARFNEDAYDAAKAALVNTLTSRGYAWAEVSGHITVNLLTHRAAVDLGVRPGPRFKIGQVTLLGLDGKLPEAPVRRALRLRPGRDFSTDDLDAAKQALLDLGVFSDVEITWPKAPSAAEGKQQVPVNEAKEPAIDIVVNVTPSLLHTLRLGAGGELDVIRTDIHAMIGWEDRNFLGGLRRFSVSLKPGVVLFPTALPTLHTPSRLLPESRLRTDLRQPGFPEARTNWLLRGEYNVYPVLLRPINEDVILGYQEIRGATGFERTFFFSHLYSSILGHVQANYPFTYHGPLDSTLGSVQLRFLELETDLSFRDDPVRPHKGVFIGNTLQYAGGLLGGNISDIKEQPDVRLYVPISRTVTFALRGSVGLLFPRNYGEALSGQSSDPEVLTRDVQLLYFRAFFSGGPNSNRGYPFRSIGPHGAAPFLSPNRTADQVFREECNPFSPSYAYDPSICAVPLGGLSLWEASAEVRFPLLGPLTGAVFADSSDVSRQKTTLRFNYPHLSAGGGLRYDTPLGPVRADVGYRIPGLQKIGGQLDPIIDGDPGTILGLPIAISIGVGQAF